MTKLSDFQKIVIIVREYCTTLNFICNIVVTIIQFNSAFLTSPADSRKYFHIKQYLLTVSSSRGFKY